MVQLRRTSQGVEITLDPGQVYDNLRDEIMKTLSRNERLFQGGGKAIFTGKTLNAAQKRELKSILFDDYGIFIVDFDDQEGAPRRGPREIREEHETRQSAEAPPQLDAGRAARRVRELQAPEPPQGQTFKDYVDAPADKDMETEEEPYLDKYSALHLRTSKVRRPSSEPGAREGYKDFETAEEPYMEKAHERAEKAAKSPAPEKRKVLEPMPDGKSARAVPAPQKQPPIPEKKPPMPEKGNGKAKKAPDRTAIVSTYNRNRTDANEMIFSIDEGSSLFIHGAVRNGQRIQYNGDVVVLGDIDEEAEIHAGGNIAVLGQALGKLHAGASGNRDAVVAAMIFRPAELTIAKNGAVIPPTAPVDKPLKAYWDGKTIIIEPVRLQLKN